MTSTLFGRMLRGIVGLAALVLVSAAGVAAEAADTAAPAMMSRADMDANAVEEASGLPYASKVRVRREDGSESPVGHMCGHDVHVTWMLGMARAMVTLKDGWSGTLILVAQPAEEVILGAQAMVDDGLWTARGLPKRRSASS